jgi:hypothetical protein
MTLAKFRTPTAVLIAGSAILAIGFGVRAGFGLFLQPMSLDNGWGREVFSLAIAVQNLIWGVLTISIGLGVFAAIVNLPMNEKPLAERSPAVGVA